MAYGFNEDKSKATVSTGGEIVTFTGTKTIPGNDYAPANVLATELASHGITNLDDWAIVSLMTKGGIHGANNYTQGTMRLTNDSANYPYASFHTDGYLQIYLYNSNDASASIDWKVVLMKIA